MEAQKQVRAKGRPRKTKIVQEAPSISQFAPAGSKEVEVSTLTMEEYEAIRLSDHLSLQQRDAAVMMGISQQSFSRLVREARKKTADALVNGKIIRISGGNFVSNN